MGARAHLPQQVPIEAYGNGGFRFGGMSHKGSILCLPSGIWDWHVATVVDLDRESLSQVLEIRRPVRLPLGYQHERIGTDRGRVRIVGE